MSNCPGCDNSSTTYSRCNPPLSSNCTFYQGDSLTCPSDATFRVCKGDNLTVIQEAIFDKVCKLSGAIDVKTIDLPLCVKEAWDQNNGTILNLLEYMLDIQCEQQQFINSLDLQNINPFVKVCLACCTPGCTTDTPVVLLLSEALDKIVTCLCVAKTTADLALKTAQDAFYQSDTVLKTQIDQQQIIINSLVNQNIITQTSLCKIEKALTDAGIPIPSTC